MNFFRRKKQDSDGGQLAIYREKLERAKSDRDRYLQEARELRVKVKELKRELELSNAWKPGLGSLPNFVPSGHFYSPHPSLEDVERVSRMTAPYGSPISWRLADQMKRFPDWISMLPEFLALLGSKQGRYVLENNQFCLGDAFSLYAFTRIQQPARVIEVGSGYSSAVMLDARDRNGPKPDLTFIEPYPGERLRGLLRAEDLQSARIIEKKLQDVPLETFDPLKSGDLLFLDSSHIAKTGSDVLHYLFHILPSLAPGVFVHIHDIFPNWEYPQDWLNEGRAWNELYFVLAYLMENPNYEVFWYLPALYQSDPSLLAPYPELLSSVGGSLYLRRRNPAEAEKP